MKVIVSVFKVTGYSLGHGMHICYNRTTLKEVAFPHRRIRLLFCLLTTRSSWATNLNDEILRDFKSFIFLEFNYIKRLLNMNAQGELH